MEDCSRVVAHFDCDAFYAQVEEVRDSSLRQRPLGVTQKYLIVTSNYLARQRGVTKLMGIKEAQQRCPELVLINGEDLTPYRRASKKVLSVLQRFGEAEKLGMDEVIVDVTQEVDSRIARGCAPPIWYGHVHRSEVGVVQENRHRVMDLRANAPQGCGACTVPLLDPASSPWQLRLMIGSQIAAEARAAIKAEAGFRSSAGIACNRMLAKLSSSLHKPDDQTVLPPTEAADFVAPLPLRAIPGVGHKLGSELKDLGLDVVSNLRAWSKASLAQKFGERLGTFLYQACRGQDPTLVKAKQPAKAITVEDSFKSCTTVDATRHILQILAPDLLARLHEEFQDEGRRPKTLTLKWRHRGNMSTRSSNSCPMPSAVQVHKAPDESQATAVVQAAMSMFLRNVSGPFVLTLLNLGGCNFVEGSCNSKGGLPAAFTRFLSAPENKKDAAAALSQPAENGGKRFADALTASRRDYGAAPSGAPISKTQERQFREQGRMASREPPNAAKESESMHTMLQYGQATVEPSSQPWQQRIGDATDKAEQSKSAKTRDSGNAAKESTAEKLAQHGQKHAEPFSQTWRQRVGIATAEAEQFQAEVPPAAAGQGGDPAGASMMDRIYKGNCSMRHAAPAEQIDRAQKNSQDLGEVREAIANGVCSNRRIAEASHQPVLKLSQLRESCSQPCEERISSKKGAVDEELQKLKVMLSSKALNEGIGLDPDMLFARKLQADELRLGSRAPAESLKRSRTGPLDTFFTRTKKTIGS